VRRRIGKGLVGMDRNVQGHKGPKIPKIQVQLHSPTSAEFKNLSAPFVMYSPLPLLCKIIALGLFFFLPYVQAQNLQKLYDLSVEDKKRLDQEEKDKKTKTENFYTEAKANGQYWKCDKNLFIFYRGYVITGAKDDASDMGKSPYDLIGNYQVVNNQVINFNFPTLPYDNLFELNIAKGEAVVFKKSLNRLEKLSCTFIK